MYSRKNLNALLHSISEDVAGIKNKADLLHIIDSRLKGFFLFSNRIVGFTDDEQGCYYFYTPELGSRNDLVPGHEEWDGHKHAIGDGVIDVAIRSDLPVLFNLVDFKGKNDSGIIRMAHETGSTELLVGVFRNNGLNAGFLAFLWDGKSGFNRDHLDFFRKIIERLSVVVSNIKANGQVEARELEKEILLSFSYDMAKVRDKHELLAVINRKLKKRFYFSHSSIVTINDDGMTFRVYLADPESKSKDHPEYSDLITSNHAIHDGVCDIILQSDEPTIVDLDQVLSFSKVPQYSKIHFESGLTQMIAIPLHGEKDIFGILAFFSDVKNNFTSKYLNFIKGIASQVSISVSNIIAHEKIRQREREKGILLSVSNDIATIRDKNDLLRVLQDRLKEFFDFDDIVVYLVDETRTYYKIFLQAMQQMRLEHLVADEIPYCEYPTDGFSESDIVFGGAVILKLTSLLGKGINYIDFLYNTGIRELVSIRLLDANREIGRLTLFSERENLLPEAQLNLLIGIADQVSIAVANIIATERIRKRELEKEILLTLSYEIAKIRDKNQLLTLINTKLKEIFYFSDSSITAIKESRESFIVFLIDPESKLQRHPRFESLMNSEYPVKDSIYDVVLQSDEPTVNDLEKIMCLEKVPEYSRILYEAGIREMVCIPLHGEKEIFGVLSFYSDVNKKFTADNLGIIKGVASQIAVAVSNILALEEVRRREKEKGILFSVSNDIATIRDKNDLLRVLQKRLKEFFNFDDSIVILYNETQSHFRIFLAAMHQKRMQHPAYEEMNGGEYPLDEYAKQNTLLSGAVIVKMSTLLNRGKKYGDFLYAAGLRQMVTLDLREGNKSIGRLSLFSETENSYAESQRNLLIGISDLVSIAVTNIIANEKVHEREVEKEMLLEFCYEIAKIRNRNDLLLLMNTKLKRMFYFSDTCIGAISDDRQTFTVYLLDMEFTSRYRPEFHTLLSSRYAVKDGVFDVILQSDEPTVFDLDDLMASNQGPRYCRVHFGAGKKRVACIPLHGEDEKFGVLFFYSDRMDSFKAEYINLIKAVAAKVAVAVANIIAIEKIQQKELEKEMLLSLSYEMAKIRDKNELLSLINTKLKKIFYFSHSTIVAINDDRETFRIYLTDPESRSKSHPRYSDLVTSRHPVNDGVCNIVLQSDEPTKIDFEEALTFRKVPLYVIIHYESGLKEMVCIPLQGEREIFGILCFYADIRNSFTPNYLNIIKGVASQVSIAVSNIIAHEEVRQREKEKGILLSISNDVTTIHNKRDLMGALQRRLKEFLNLEDIDINVVLLNERRTHYRIFLSAMGQKRREDPNFEEIICGEYPNTRDEQTTNNSLAEGIHIGSLSSRFNQGEKLVDFLYNAGLRGFATIPLRDGQNIFGTFSLISEKENVFLESQMNLLLGIADQVSAAVINIIANDKIEKQLYEINKYKQKLEQENLYLQEEIDTVFNHSELIGSGPGMQKVYHLMSQVSHTNSTVLILGETGTGKELIARAIHNSSPQKDKLMVKVNCAALPAGLVESELFGHERGSFTGALERRIGKFELANNSTLFLDEIGEMPLELQVKLLRVIQEKEIERVGGKATIKVNVRIIAATNRDLNKEVQQGRFRSDLYYRLNVFPIIIPPLRERREDLLALTSFFIKRFARNTGKNILGVSGNVMEAITAYHWPGNVRELEHLIERSILLADGAAIKDIHLPVENNRGYKAVEESIIKPIEEMEKEYIMSVLKICNGKVQGAGGAAELLKIPPTTLHSKMKRLGIVRRHSTETFTDWKD